MIERALERLMRAGVEAITVLVAYDSRGHGVVIQQIRECEIASRDYICSGVADILHLRPLWNGAFCVFTFASHQEGPFAETKTPRRLSLCEDIFVKIVFFHSPNVTYGTDLHSRTTLRSYRSGQPFPRRYVREFSLILGKERQTPADSCCQQQTRECRLIEAALRQPLMGNGLQLPPHFPQALPVTTVTDLKVRTHLFSSNS